VLSEEALVLIVVVCAVALLVLGVLELLSPTRSRHPHRRMAFGRDPWRRARTGAPSTTRVRASRMVPEDRHATEAEPPIERLLLSQAASAPHAAWPRPRQLERSPLTPKPAPDEPKDDEIEILSAPPVEESPASIVKPASSPPPSQPVAPRVPESPVERCWSLYEARHFTDVVREGTGVLQRVNSGAYALADEERARLLGVVGLARQAMGDHEAARGAFEQAIVVAPDPARLTWQRHLAALALQAGQQALARADTGAGADSEEGLNLMHTAVVWFDAGLKAAPGDAALQGARATARTTLWATYDRVVGSLIQRQEYQAARRLLRRALSDEGCPDTLQAPFRDLLSMTFSGEVGQLTAEAIRRMQDGREDEALATLDRAETILATIPADGVPDKRRQELERRLWWSYTKLGIRRVENGNYEDALGPLLHALTFDGVGRERQEDTRAPLLRALQRIVAARGPLIERMTADGDREGATVLCERLRHSLREAVDRGLPREQLAEALAKTDALFEQLNNTAH
jgi:tetratricopeptide (TPR) repeat protein